MVVEETVKGTAEGLVHGAKVLTNLADPSGILKHPNVQEAKEVITEDIPQNPKVQDLKEKIKNVDEPRSRSYVYEQPTMGDSRKGSPRVLGHTHGHQDE